MRIHKKELMPSDVVCVDKSRGIYLVKTMNSGSAKPVHVQITTHTQQMSFECTAPGCRMVTGPAARGGSRIFVCEHVRSALNTSNEVSIMEHPNLDEYRDEDENTENV